MTILSKLRPREYSAVEILHSCFRPGWRVALLGGAPRDLVFGATVHDLDFIVENCPSDLEFRDWVNKIDPSAVRNGFGGARLHVDGVQVDIWLIESHRIGRTTPLRKKPSEPRIVPTIETVAENGVTFDIDTGYVVLGRHRLSDSTESLQALYSAQESRKMELRTPRGVPPAYVFVRAAKFVLQYGLHFGPDLVKYIQKNADSEVVSDDQLKQAALYRGVHNLCPSAIRALLSTGMQEPDISLACME